MGATIMLATVAISLLWAVWLLLSSRWSRLQALGVVLCTLVPYVNFILLLAISLEVGKFKTIADLSDRLGRWFDEPLRKDI